MSEIHESTLERIERLAYTAEKYRLALVSLSYWFSKRDWESIPAHVQDAMKDAVEVSRVRRGELQKEADG